MLKMKMEKLSNSKYLNRVINKRLVWPVQLLGQVENSTGCSILSGGSVIRFLSSQPVTVWVAKATCITLLSQHCLSSWICSPEDSARLTKGEGGSGICVDMHACTHTRKRDSSISIYSMERCIQNCFCPMPSYYCRLLGRT